jgi:hypothetical protein
MKKDEHDLTESAVWFRDKLDDTINYGLGAITIIGGWLLSNDSIISIHHQEDAEKHEAAIVLGVILPLAWLFWYFFLTRLHSQLPNHETVVSRRNLHLLAFGGLIVFLLIWCVVADVITVPSQFITEK